MLVLSRKAGEFVVVKDENGQAICRVHLVEIRGNKVRLGFEGGQDVVFVRSEIDGVEGQQVQNVGTE